MTSARRSLVALLCGLAVAALAGANPRAADLQPGTTAAFDKYVRLTEARLEAERQGRLPFLWIDTLPEAARRDAEGNAARGEVVIARMETRDGDHRIDCPDGLRHHWVGTTLVPAARAAQVAAIMQSYERYPDMYRPNVRRSSVLSRDGDHFVVALQLFEKKVISVVLNTDSDVRYLSISPTRLQVRSASVRIAEVEDPDSPEPREKPVGHDNGFMWRFNNYCALDERAGGTYVQCESVSLSRAIPFGLGWLIGPFVTGIPRESLEFTLSSMRSAVSRSVMAR